MITLTPAEKQYLLDDDYSIEMEVNTVNEDNITITEANLVQGSFAANRFSCVGNTIEVGSANAAEISFTLRNDDGTFDDVVFEGAQVIVWLRRGTSGDYTLNLRLFTARVDEVHHAIDSIQLVLLDSMVKLDRTAANLTYNTPQGVIQQICSACGITYNSAKSRLVNGAVELATPTTENLSYRQVLMWIAQITGTCAFFDPEDKLVLGWYTLSTNQEIDYIKKSNRFSSDLDENEIIVTGVSATVGETTYYNKDDSVDADYLVVIEGNELISAENVETILSGLANRLSGFSYTPFSATTMNLCWILPLDMTEFWDKDDNPHDVIITDWTFTPHSSLQLAGKGESATRKGYASNPPFTAQQSRIIEKLKRDVENVDVDDRITAVLGLNDAINHGMMLHTTTVDGKEYRHNAALLEDSTYICTANSGGFAWTNKGWNDGAPVWEYGISSDGSAVLEQLSAYAISADVVSAGILQSKDGSTTLDMNNGTARFFNGALLYDSANGFRFGTTVTFGKSNLGQDVIDFIESQGGEDDGINVHATAGTLSGNDYPLTTTEQVTELAEGDIVAITFPNGINFAFNTSGSTYLYKPRTVSIGSNTYTLLNANGTTDWCNVKDSTDYSGNVTVKYIARLLDGTLKLCELVEVENVIDDVMTTQSGEPSALKLTNALTNAQSGTVVKADVSGLQYGLAFSGTSPTATSFSSPYFSIDGSNFSTLLSKNHYSREKGIADAYTASELYYIGSTGGSGYVGNCSSSGSDRVKVVTDITPTGFVVRDGAVLNVNFTYANTNSYPVLRINGTDYDLFYDDRSSGGGGSYGYLTPSCSKNWYANSTVEFEYSSSFASGYGAGFVARSVNPVGAYYFTPKTEEEPTGVSSVNIILENLRTSSGTTLRAFELRFDPVSTQPAVIDQEARDKADLAFLRAKAAGDDIQSLNTNFDNKVKTYLENNPISVDSEITTFYGTCETDGSAQIKDVAVSSSSWKLSTGVILNVKFYNENTYNPYSYGIKLRVNSSAANDAKYVTAKGSYVKASSYYNIKADSVIQFVYNGSQWVMSETSADALMSSWCAANDVTKIDGSKIYTGTVAAQKVQAESINITDALLANLLACNATITGLLKIIQSKISTSTKKYTDALNYWKDAIAANFGYSSYDDIPTGTTDAEVIYYGSIRTFINNTAAPLAQMYILPSESPFKMYLKISGNDYCKAAMSAVGLLFEDPSNTTSIEDENSYENLSVYGYNAQIGGLLTVGGKTVTPLHVEEGEFTITITNAESGRGYEHENITFESVFSSAPSVSCSTSNFYFFAVPSQINQYSATIRVVANGTVSGTRTITVNWKAIGT